MYSETTTLLKLAECSRFYRIMQGGMSSGKTIASLMALVGYAEENPGKFITIATDTVPNLRDGAGRDLRNLLDGTNRRPYYSYRATENTWTVKGNGSQIQLLAMDDPLKARGSRRDVLYVNEANRLRYDTFDQLASRTRDFVMLDFNPSGRFWAHDELLRHYRSECDYFITTYKDNEALSPREVRNIERHDHNSNWWRVYGLGQIGELENNIYSGWVTVDSIPEDARLLIYGLDFGDHPDPTAMVGIWRKNEDYYIEQLVYQSDTLVSTLGGMIEDIVHSHGDRPIICDYGGGGGTLIRELQSRGLQAVPADKSAAKGESSVLEGISELQQLRNVHIVGKDLEREYLSYQHRTTKKGVVLPTPQDGNDHLMDATRYGYHVWHRDDMETRASLERASMYSSAIENEESVW